MTSDKPEEPRQRPKQSRRKRRGEKQFGGAGRWKTVVLFTLISLVFLAVGCFLTHYLVKHADRIVALGLVGHFFYVALIPIGLCAAGFLFGALRSYATWTGKVLGGWLDLGGPVVAVFLVILLGFWLVDNPTTFSLAVYVQGVKGKQDRPLRDEGEVVMRLSQNSRSKNIDSDGKALFTEIPPSFRGQQVPIWVEHKDYEAAGDTEVNLDTNTVDIVVRRKPGLIRGQVRADGQPVAGARVVVAGIEVRTGDDGRFRLEIPSERMKSTLDARVVAEGFQERTEVFVPGSNDAVILLERRE